MTFTVTGRSALRRAWLAFAVVFAVVLAAAGCASLSVQLPAVVATAPEVERGFAAGAARVDITPPPGYPMGGYSRIGRFSRGVWLRLFARALYFEDARNRLALVACDLWSLPRGLHDRVAELLASPWFARRAGGRAPQRHEIVLAATHTHHSPAAYSTNRFFSTFAAPAVGFDPAMFEMLAARIALAIADAAAVARPARLAEARAPVDGLVRNRSFEPFLRDAEAAELLARNRNLSACDEQGYDPRACRAVDATVRVLRVEDAAAGNVIAAAVFLAAHPTTISHESPLYSSDLFGALALNSERIAAAPQPAAHAGSGKHATKSPSAAGAGAAAIAPIGAATAASAAHEAEAHRAGTPAPVVAVFNGAQGDVSFRWRRQDRSNLLALLERVAPFVESVLARDARGLRRLESPALESRFDLFSLAHRRVRDGRGRTRRTARLAMPGRASICGAEDGRSDAPRWVSHEGKRGAFEWGAHGRKIGALDLVEIGGVVIPPFWISRALAPVLAPEREVAVSVHRIGPLAVTTLPGEFTTVMGARVRRAVASSLRVPADDVVVVGLAQSTAYYFATPEEYALQHYEGSSTVWGRHAGTFVAQRAAKLAAAPVEDWYPRRASKRRYRPGLRRSFGPRLVEQEADEKDRGLRYVLGGEDAGTQSTNPPLPRWCWREPILDLHSRSAGAARAWRDGAEADALVVRAPRLTPRVTIEVRSTPPQAYEAEGIRRARTNEAPDVSGAAASRWAPLVLEGGREDDDGLRIVSVAGTPRRGQACWCAYWLAPADLGRSALYRFAVTRSAGERPCAEAPDCSPAFSLDAPLVANCPDDAR